MKGHRTAAGTTVAVLAVIAAVLATGLVYDYTTTASQVSNFDAQVSTLNVQISSLEQSGQHLCQLLQYLGTVALNQIRTDRSMIATLNSTKPSGYASTITILNSLIAYDQYIVNQTNANGNGAGPSNEAGSTCAMFSQP